MLVTVVGVGTYDAADISRLAVELKPALIRWFLDAGFKSWRKNRDEKIPLARCVAFTFIRLPDLPASN
jgi:hypothetical protein